jgi:ADP-ribose pyrophosphatase YjhB (NUDIX family)
MDKVLNVAGTSDQLKRRIAAAAAKRPGLIRLARATARRLAGRHYVAASAVVVLDEGVLLAEHRFRAGCWSLPGGWVRTREDPARACERELREELGLEVRARRVVACELHAIDGQPLRYSGITVAYRCDALDPVAAKKVRPCSIEVSDARWVPRSDCRRHLAGFELAAVEAAFEVRAT